MTNPSTAFSPTGYGPAPFQKPSRPDLRSTPRATSSCADRCERGRSFLRCSPRPRGGRVPGRGRIACSRRTAIRRRSVHKGVRPTQFRRARLRATPTTVSRSRLHTLADRPYDGRLASADRLARRLERAARRRPVRTLPRCAIAMVGVTRVDDRRRHEQARPRRSARRPRAAVRRPRCAARDMRLDLAQVVGADRSRRPSCLGSSGSPTGTCARALGELGDEVLGDRALQQQARTGVAAFAGVEIGAEGAASSAASRSASGKTICGFLPPSSIDTFFSVAEAAAIAARPTAGRAGERDHVDARVAGHRRADFGTIAGDDVADAAGQAGFGEQSAPDAASRPTSFRSA